MRKSVMMVGIPFAVAGVAVAVALGVRGSGKPADASFSSDLQRAEAAGLELAQAQSAQKFNITETVPETKPEPAKTIRKSTSGPKAVRSNTPTVKAAAEQTVADVVEEIPQVQVMQTAAAPTTVEAPAPAPSPVPVTTLPAPAQDNGPILVGGTGRGTSGNGGGMGTGTLIGVIFGSVLRGGGVDGDNCDPRPTRRGGTNYPPVYGRSPSGTPQGGVYQPASTPRSAPHTPVSTGARPRGGR